MCSDSVFGCQHAHNTSVPPVLFLSVCSLFLPYIGMPAGSWKGRSIAAGLELCVLLSSCWMVSFRTYSQSMAPQKWGKVANLALGLSHLPQQGHP